ncbi:tRNA 2'-phosphotransferase 1 [Paramyrothecium foliicola]|nr:tRNA 2'-phosphotransferase 1 [Paramyrothecium foliicola]
MTEQTSLGFTAAGLSGHGRYGPSTSNTTTTTTTNTTTTAAASPSTVNALTATTTTSASNDARHGTGAPSLSLHSHRQSHSSSKLPAFRFADLKPGVTTSLAHPSFVNLGPPTPVSPASAPDALPQPCEPPVAQDSQTTATHGAREPDHLQNSRTKTAPPQFTSPVIAQISTSSPPELTDLFSNKRSATFPFEEPSESATHVLSPTDAAATNNPRRPPASRSLSGPSATAGQAPPVHPHRYPSIDLASGISSPPNKTSLDSPPGQRELILPKTLSQSDSPDERRASQHRSPPVSYKPPINATTNQSSNANPVRVPPIRAFRSSGSRRSLVLDMNLNFSTRPYDSTDETSDLNHDHTLRALEGRPEPDSTQSSPPPPVRPTQARRDTLNDDDTGDVFLKIAREENPARQVADVNTPGETTNVASRFRASHRRPLSTTVAAYHPTSPPQLSRRLSDQQETSRLRRQDDDRASDVSRITTYRSIAREKVASIFPGEDLIRARPVGSALRPSPVTPRASTSQETTFDQSTQHRRRPSMTDANSTITPRSSSFRSMGAGHAQARSHGASPLVKSVDFQGPPVTDTQHGVEGTESSTSTAAPSTVWDELDDLKSRIHRLELTGKLPATSGAAMSRLSDERPPTATTTVTTVSSSPKRSGGGAAAPSVEAVSTTSSHREAHHPVLQSALAKSKLFLSAEVFRALEAAANDAMTLSSMMGSPGQPGPISSGASTIGTGAPVTDRQLRRKADSVCRSLTELCVALGEDVARAKPAPTVSASQAAQPEGPSTPVAPKSLTISTSQRRQSIVAEPDVMKSIVSPRAMSKFEERRNSILSGNTLPSPRVINAMPSTPNDTPPNRRSSLLVARSRRAGTEEPDDGRKSSILRTRRAGTEEPEEGRKTSLLVRGRRGTMGEEDDPRAVSRATDVYGNRAAPNLSLTMDGSLANESMADSQLAAQEERAYDKASRGSGRRGGRGGGRGGKGGGGQGREVQISRTLSKLLRHQAESAGIKLDNEGFAPLNRVLAWGPLRSLGVTFAEVQSVVVNNDKQRYTLKPNPNTNPDSSTDSTDPAHWLIRANQGHSIRIESEGLLSSVTLDAGNLPARVVHGTYFGTWPAIVQSGGLRPMGRNHVHCSAGTPEEGVVSGMRRDAELVLDIDLERSLRDGLKWWQSDNGVLLTEGDETGLLSAKYFKLVTGRGTDVGVLWKDGEKVADLPEGLKGRVPPGKGPRGGGRGGRGRHRGS